ncbi:hypothetical protein [Rubritalea tangerina]|uniref:Uncharacterized protein n=1 Tax=Rubritalea tangerina TaxID=430798 RepID=A0ABW4ZEH0_9BACT
MKKLPHLLTAMLVSPLFGQTLYEEQNFQSIEHNTMSPDGWVSVSGVEVRAFGPETSEDFGGNDRALIGKQFKDWVAVRNLGVKLQPRSVYQLDLHGGLYVSSDGASSTLEWELGVLQGGNFVALSEAARTELHNSGETSYFFGKGKKQALKPFILKTDAAPAKGTLAIRLKVRENGERPGWAGFDNIQVAQKEGMRKQQESSALISLGGSMSIVLRDR